MRVMWWSIVACMLIATLGVGEVLMAEEPKKEPEVKTKVRIEIGQASFGYRDQHGDKTSLPEVPIGEYFKVKVKWTGEAARGENLILSQFRYAALEVESAFSQEQEEGSAIWNPTEEATLWLTQDGKEAMVSEVNLTRPGSGDESEAILKLEISDLTKRILGSADGRQPPTGALLVFFDVELTDRAGRVYYFDPPWAGKRGGG